MRKGEHLNNCLLILLACVHAKKLCSFTQLRRAIFHLLPDVAYGSLGARDEKGWQVPPDTPVTFDVQLLDVIKAPENGVAAEARNQVNLGS